MGSTERKQIKSTRTAFTIIERVSSTDGATVSELAETLGRSKSTVHAHLQTLTEWDTCSGSMTSITSACRF
ncbi:helix-turn-helix domain-containing protein [Natrialba aegyptia]|uniref:IclR family transcriptional regulator n=1 Tax=Natrialba aegyptia DSM 13077 TaxID=1227491 RepID=M0AFY4_9EURY|nr:helix-turn-helix domain-containing protein [Natrialba aegyptia]ELY97640.1 IclR family transcriptional regulator [Natrialba aegyptia DSM 13077]